MLEAEISQLVEYGVRRGWLESSDRIWAANRILEALGLDDFGGLCRVKKLPPIDDILHNLCVYARGAGISDDDDLFDTRLMGLITPRPSEVIRQFDELYAKSPRAATDWYYSFSQETNYIRIDRIARDIKWTVQTEYGGLDITINLSKPEKDPREIADAGKAKASGYPKCLLCAENEGYAGHIGHPARQNHRMIPILLNGTHFFLQYSPYIYYNEHCIVLNKSHVPMCIDRRTFENLLDFVDQFPHYFLGSNADLPIVGGSVLSHDHYQGGQYTFAMEQAFVEEDFVIPGFEDVETGILKWPMPVIRLKSPGKTRIVSLAEHILNKWRVYDDPGLFVFHETGGVPHSTITPIARKRSGVYELDLVLRNNITTNEFPMGVFHPHRDKHHIKRENIGLIEVMGLAILPARLKTELHDVAESLAKGYIPQGIHAEWAENIVRHHPELNRNNVDWILQQEVGRVYVNVLDDAAVFKRTPSGRGAFRRFMYSL